MSKFQESAAQSQIYRFDVSQKVSRGRPDFILAAGKTTNFEIGHMNAEILTQDTFGHADHLCSTDHSMLHSQVLR